MSLLTVTAWGGSRQVALVTLGWCLSPHGPLLAQWSAHTKGITLQQVALQSGTVGLPSASRARLGFGCI